MIPTKAQILDLWKTHALPKQKQRHCQLVAHAAVWFARRLMDAHEVSSIDVGLLEAAALLHDIDKMAQTYPHEHHPDAGVRILKDAGFADVADLVRTHPLHAILDQNITPRTWEQKILYLADKMTKYEVMTVDTRFALWRGEDLPQDAVRVLDAAYPKVKALEQGVCSRIHVDPENVGELVNQTETSTMGDILPRRRDL